MIADRVACAQRHYGDFLGWPDAGDALASEDRVALEILFAGLCDCSAERESGSTRRIDLGSMMNFEHLGVEVFEYLCDLVPSMWAEKLHDGSFEGLSPYKFAYLRDTDFREKPWYPSGSTNRAQFVRDRDNPVSGLVCQKIAVTGAAPCTVGISQDGIAVQAGKPLN